MGTENLVLRFITYDKEICKKKGCRVQKLFFKLNPKLTILWFYSRETLRFLIQIYSCFTDRPEIFLDLNICVLSTSCNCFFEMQLLYNFKWPYVRPSVCPYNSYWVIFSAPEIELHFFVCRFYS